LIIVTLSGEGKSVNDDTRLNDSDNSLRSMPLHAGILPKRSGTNSSSWLPAASPAGLLPQAPEALADFSCGKPA
jgi:hypothetical protein